MKKIKKIKRKLVLLVDLLNRKDWGYSYVHADTPKLKSAARKLHADVFLSRKYVTNQDITEEGFISEKLDPYHLHSEYFCALDDNKPTAIVRLITHDEKKGLMSYQIFHHTTKAPETYGLQHLDLSKVLEVSAFARKLETSSLVAIDLIGVIWSYSKKKGVDKWIFTLDHNIYKLYKKRYKNIIHKVGDAEELEGSYNAKVVACYVDIDQVMLRFCKDLYKSRYKPSTLIKKRMLERFISRIDPDLLDSRERRAINKLNISI